jgi:hypothetical protein
MNSFKRHIYKNNKVNKKVTLLTLDPTSATLSSSLPNDVVVQVSSNSSWSVGQIPSWFSITGGSGSGDGLFVIDTQNNNSNITRSHLLSVTAGEIGETVTRTFLITQQAFVPTLTLDPTSKDLLGVNPGNFVVDVISNTSWSVITTPPSWFSIIGGSGSGDGGFSIASIEDNPNGPRSFELVVSTNTSNGSLGVTKTFTINQEAVTVTDTLSIDPEDKNASMGPETYPIDVLSNTTWNVSKNASWVDLDFNSFSGNNTVNVSVLNNGSTSTRSTTITFTTGSLTEVHTLSQFGLPEPTYSSIVLGPGSSSSNACFNFDRDATSTLYIPFGESFTFTDELYSNSSGSTFASVGWYSNGSIARNWNGSEFTGSNENC